MTSGTEPRKKERILRSTPARVLAALALLVVIGAAGFQVRTQARAMIESGDLPASPPLMRVAGVEPPLDLSNLTIPREEIRSGGPGKDGIPAILDPKFVAAARADYLEPGDLVVGYTHGGVERAYPLRILVWHEIVNDVVGGRPVAITYCPLCGTAMVFDARVDGERLTFGVSGLLYNSDVLMYDHKTDSLWSQLKMEAVSGPYADSQLEWVPSELMTWEAWREGHPGGEVLSTDTGFARDYGHQPYVGYEDRPDTMFPVPAYRDDLPTKAWVAGVLVNDTAKAYPLEALRTDEDGRVEDTVAGERLVVTYDDAARQVQVARAGDGERVPHVNVFWFAWQAFYPETELYAP